MKGWCLVGWVWLGYVVAGWGGVAAAPPKVPLWILPVQHVEGKGKYETNDAMTTTMESHVESSTTHRLVALPEGYHALLKRTGQEVGQLQELEKTSREKPEQALAVRVSRLGRTYTLRGVVYRFHQGQWKPLKRASVVKRQTTEEHMDLWLGELWSSLFPPPPPPPPPTPKAGDRQTFKAKGVTFAMRFIPVGSFTMGSPDDEKGRSSDEGPQRQVRLTRGFWMLETEVTQGQYKVLVGENPSHFKKCGDTCPVESVSWDEARVFADKLSTAQCLPACTATDRGIFQCKGWRLPTEAEWEYAARAGTTTRFHTGENITTGQARFEARGFLFWGDRGTTVVGSFLANAWGLYDMHGNVYEWVADRYKDTYDSSDLENPLQLLESDSGGRSGRVMRGGSWDSHGGRLRSASRSYPLLADRNHYTGFRLSRSP